MINNAGNESNLRVLAGGFGIEPEAAMKWLGRNSIKADWDPNRSHLRGWHNRHLPGLVSPTQARPDPQSLDPRRRRSMA